ncbi:glycoside hydrolase family 3 N-terminal domain-containing protein [Nocardioides sp. GY 10127]|uniref:glycoside hydrolase family 3 protein n=1 Tax=Nocardioides sp. GY 10127 TaxID=2569762 RepID=UPI0010A867D9|nr:glycoside hydrolase family 3 N-terminal domain-containing protein [Nocardioides sp. GY 10127]TIC82629.1 glycoside hydrolase family 3 protein [Nocardioides sp. GY 10127]
MTRLPLQHLSDGTAWRDLNGNGVLDPYEDPRLSPEERADDLVGRLSLAEKAGLLFQSMIDTTAPRAYDEPSMFGLPTHRAMLTELMLNHVNVLGLPGAAEAAEWINGLQELAEATPHGIPMTISSDPRHGVTHNLGMALAADGFSAWPETLGLAALALGTGDEKVVEEFGALVREEYRAVGIGAALHPQIDLATEPRWGRQLQTFGQDPELTTRLVAAFLRGLQGDELGPDSVAATTKHFPGGGPQKDGEDPHFPYGTDQVYPGGRFAEHLEPFRAALEAGTAAVMPYYAKPVGLVLDGEPVEEVAFGFNKRIVTGLLREELGFDGVVVTDWGLVTDLVAGPLTLPARAWGVEHLTPVERVARILDAGCDQLGGEFCPELVLEAVRTGLVSEERLDVSVRRLLLVKLRLGLFDDPFVDPQAAAGVVGSHADAGRRAQSESVVVLETGPTGDQAGDPAGEAVLPLRPHRKVYVEGVAPEAVTAAGLGTVVDDPAEADLALVRVGAPFEPRNQYFLEAMTHQGSLDFPEEVVAHLAELAGSCPVVLDVHLDRPAILTPLLPHLAALTVSFGTGDAAWVDALTGRTAPRGRLPVELPRSMAAVLAGDSDVPGGTEDPLYPFGFGRDLG